ncbi:MarR family transcriptional regulator [Microbacterium jejuense]|uniref:MarR family transcriptional regulator n=1 Tax=Microbacterium jejuense TaxID=1263637 RepID=A0ABS7HKB7_9MICO|nr:helix-turn-helix domain-containing protein [Microbacterium jejuense]MBW9093394.1 MarR family transcriptional regulator [Microbacterium jejuense]
MSSERPFSPVISLLTVASVWDAHLGAQLRDLGLTTRKYGLLAHIRSTPGISFSELARRSQVTVQSAHTAVQSLVADGLVADATAHAGAASDLRVTDRGGEVLLAAEQRLAALDADLASGAPDLAAALKGLHEEPFGLS